MPGRGISLLTLSSRAPGELSRVGHLIGSREPVPKSAVVRAFAVDRAKSFW